MKCEQCVYRDKKNLGICKSCSLYEPIRPRRDLEQIDIFEMAKKLRQKERQEGIQAVRRRIPSLSDCPECGEYSLHFDGIHDLFECQNPGCILWGKPISNSSARFAEVITRLLRQ